MTKSDFLEALRAELKHRHVADVEDIVEEYQQHFAFKLADGYSQEEIAAKLGTPKEIAAQYDAAPGTGKGGKRALTVAGLCVADFFFAILCVLLYAWALVMMLLVISFGLLCVCLLGDLGRFPMFSVPAMPYPCAVLFGIAAAGLAVLTLVGTVYFFRFMRQLIRSFGRFHKNALDAAAGRATLPALPVYPQLAGKVKRRLRRAAVAAVLVFAVCLTAGFIVSAISAGTVEFWHAWGWFGYGR